MKLLILLLLTAIHLSAPAQADVLTYKGASLNTTKADFLEKLPLYKCSGERCTFIRDDCQGTGIGISDKSIYEAFAKRGKECEESTSFGGTLVLYGVVTFDEKGMAEVNLTTVTSQMNQLADAVESKFGRPASIDRSPVKTRAGVELENWKKTWKVNGGVLTLDFRSGTVEEGKVFLVSQERFAALEANRKKRVAEGAKDF